MCQSILSHMCMGVGNLLRDSNGGICRGYDIVYVAVSPYHKSK